MAYRCRGASCAFTNKSVSEYARAVNESLSLEVVAVIEDGIVKGVFRVLKHAWPHKKPYNIFCGRLFQDTHSTLFQHSEVISRSRQDQEVMCLSTSNHTPAAIDLESTNAVKEKRTSNKRRLTFAPWLAHVVNTGISLEDYSREELDSSWWSGEDLKNMFDDAKYIVQAVRECGPTCIELLDVSYQRSKSFAKRLDGKGMDALLQDPSHCTSELESWTSRGYGCRGLEKYSSCFQQAERIAGPQKMVAMVIETGRAGISNDEIADIYAEQSRANLIFARLMAVADYLTAYGL